VSECKKKNKKTVFFTLSISFSFILSGLNEILPIVYIYVLSLIILISFITKKKVNVFLLVLLICVIIFSSISFLSPSNFNRLDINSVKPNIPVLILKSFYQAVHNIYFLAFKSPIVFVNIILTPIFIKASKRTQYYLHPVYSLLIIVCLLALVNFPQLIGYGFPALPRVKNSIFFIAFLGCFWFFQNVIIYISMNKKRVPNIPQFLKLIFLIIILLFNFQYSRIKDAYIDIIEGKAKSYKIQMEKRITEINSDENATVFVSKFDKINFPKTIFINDIFVRTVRYHEYYAFFYNKEKILEK